jgi:hypothetical protein
MFTKISSLTLAILLFLVLMPLLPKPNYNVSPLVFAVSILGLILASLAINFKRLNFTWPHLLLPVIYLLAVGAVFMLIPSTTLCLIFLILVSINFYFLEVKLGKESHFLQNIYLLSVFGLYLGLFAVQFYFNLKNWYIVPIAFLLTYLLSVQGLAGFSLPAKRYFYLLTALICAEATWGLTFWPTHYFVNSIVLFSIFYLLWIFSFSAFFGKLSRQKIYWQLSLVAIVLTLTLTTAAWKTIR